MIYRRLWMFLLILAGTLLVDAQETLSIDNFRIARGETKEIAINLNNTSSVRALQVQIILPDGVKMSARPQIVQSRNGSYIDEFGEVVEAVKTLSYNQWNDGSYMITVNADDGIPFAGTEGAVIMLTLQAEETAPLGQSLISLKNMELVYEDGQTFVSPPDVTSLVDIYQIVKLTVLSGGNGTVTGGGAYEVGDTVTLTATPILGFQFAQWSDGSNENPYTFIASENKTLTAFFETVPYYVIYMVDGVEYKRVQMLYGDAVVLENEPTKEGYTFSGWSKTPSTMPAENVIVSGTFTVNNYNLVYILDGVEYKRESIAYGTTILAESIPSKIGHSFTGWSGLPSTMPAKDVMVTGRFVANSYEISFSLDGTIIKTAYVTYGAAITPPEVPTKEGYSFSGWVNLPSTMPAGDIVINGSFMVNSYVITYMVDGVEYYTESIAYGSTVEAIAAPAKEGYAFSGWSELPATMPASDITISGSFAVNSYTVTYMVDGELYKTESYAYGSMVEAIAAPIKEGYTFGGWSGVPSTMPAKDITISGSFAVNSYTVTYMVDGDLYKTENYAYGSYITAADFPVKEGHTFGGWSEIPATMPAGNITITGSFAVNCYTITYMVDGVEYKTESIAYGSMVEAVAAPIKEGYTFGGWSGVPSTMPAKDITISGSFTVNSYTVTYMVDGKLYKTESYAYGAAITAAEAPSKEGHTFCGWSEAPETMPAENVTINGSFAVNSYTITFVLESEVFVKYTLKYGSAIEVPEAPQKEGLTFSGWGKIPDTMPAQDLVFEGSYMNNPYTIIYIVDGVEYHRASVEYGSVITLIPAPVKEGHTFSGWSEVPETMPAGDITVSGSFTVNGYTIIYYVDGEEFYKESIPFGTSVSTIEAPQKEGYTFSGWSEIPATMPAKDVTVNGGFSINTYIATFMVDGEEYCRVNVVYGEEIILVDTPTKEGHTFSGWGEVPTTMPAKDITINGSFSINSYTVTYVVDGEVYKTESITYGSKLTPIAVPVKEGHTFSGWGGVPNTMPAKDVTINGTFTINTYTITYMVDGEVYQTMIVTYGEAITLIDNPSKEGYTFSGWLDAPETMPAKDVTINGRFVTNGYTVTYLLDGEVYKTFQVEYGSKIPIVEEPAKEGYTFGGWSEVPSTMPAKDITVSGSFTVNSYTVTYMVDGELYKTESYAYGATITAADAPTKEGYAFSGWSEIPATMPASDVTVTGSFAVSSYTITYMVDGELYKTESYAYGAEITAAEAPTKEGHTFSGWSGIPATMPAKDVTISGIFTINKYVVTFRIGNEVIAAESLEYGAAIVVPEAPDREGYTFDGWGEVAETVPAGDVTYEGTYTINSYQFTYVVDGETVKSDSVAYGTAIVALEEPTKEGHTFSGWSEVLETMPAKDVTVTGYFTINKYLVTFKVDDEVIAADSLEYGATIVAPEAPDREGYTFDGWGEVAETVPAGDVTYEGTYTVNIYKVYYYVGEELVHTAEIAYGEAIPEYVYEPTEEGCTFLGWIGETYETMPAHDVTYTANIDDVIRQLTIDNSQMAIYDLSGRKIEVDDLRELEKGVYIVNGHKVVVEE